MLYFLDLFSVIVPYFIHDKPSHQGPGSEFIVKGNIVYVGVHLEIRSVRTSVMVCVPIFLDKRPFIPHMLHYPAVSHIIAGCKTKGIYISL